MKRSELEELIKTHTADDGIDYDAIAKSVNDETNVIRDKAIEKYKETAKQELADEIKNEFIKQYDFENVDQFKAFVDNSKATSDEVKAKATRLEQELEQAKAQLQETESKYKDVDSKLQTYSHKQIAKKLGVKDDMLDYALFEAKKLVNDEVDVEKALGKLIEEKPVLAQEQERVKVGTPPTETEPVKPGGNYERYLELKKQGKL